MMKMSEMVLVDIILETKNWQRRNLERASHLMCSTSKVLN
jgi:hypothetical protein